ncbi:MAG TPA: metallophosphoesterase [Rhodanobacteraceae bacterium]|nr:metallophosphoesterase [Rhodanobacteraceae bacterium]
MGWVLASFTGAIWLYLFWRFVYPMPGGRWTKGVLALCLLLAAEYRGLVHLIFGGVPSQVLPRDALIGLSWAFGTVLLLALVLLIRDVLGVLAFIVRRAAGRQMLAGGRRLVVIGLLVAVLAGWGVWQAVKVPAVKTVDIHVPGLPAAFDGYRIAQLSDIHATRLLPAWWVASVVDKTNALHPDLIVITGDLEDGMPAARAADVRPLRNLHAPDGVLVIPGNHEYYSDYRGWMALFRHLGLDVLENTHVLIRHDGATVAVAGLTDRAADRFGLPGPDLPAALAGVPSGVPVMVLSHRPDTARDIARAGVMLELAGHTHGGQILGPSLLTRWVNNGFVSGLYKVGDMRLYVSNGTGLWAGLAMRLGRPSEITQIVLHAGP